MPPIQVQAALATRSARDVGVIWRYAWTGNKLSVNTRDLVIEFRLYIRSILYSLVRVLFSIIYASDLLFVPARATWHAVITVMSIWIFNPVKYTSTATPALTHTHTHRHSVTHLGRTGQVLTILPIVAARCLCERPCTRCRCPSATLSQRLRLCVRYAASAKWPKRLTDIEVHQVPAAIYSYTHSCAYFL